MIIIVLSILVFGGLYVFITHNEVLANSWAWIKERTSVK